MALLPVVGFPEGLPVVGLRTVVGLVVAPVAGFLVVPVVRVVDLAVPRVLRGVVVVDGLFAGLLLDGRLVLPPPITPPPAAGSCWAFVMFADANKHTNAVREIRETRHRVNIQFSPATLECGSATKTVILRLRMRFGLADEHELLAGIIVLKVGWREHFSTGTAANNR